MRLGDLEARFIVHTPTTDDSGGWREVEAYLGSHGVSFLCPKCFRDNGGPVGTHMMVCWFVGMVPDHITPKPGRWVPSGSGIEDLTFIGPGAASVAISGGCNAHFHVKRGAIEFA